MTERWRDRWNSTRGLVRWLGFVLLLVCMAVAWPQAARGDTFPSKTITLILPFPPRGATDVQIRALALAASRELGQPIVIVNRPGVGGTLGPASMAQSAAPDGYTISLVAATLFRLPHLMKVMDPKVVKVLHDAFRKAMNDPSYLRVLEQNDQVPIYMSSEEYRKYAIEQTAREKLFVQELGIKLD